MALPVQSNLFHTSVYPYGYRDALFVLLVIFYTFIKQHNRKNSAKSVCYVKTAGICWLYCLLTYNISKGKSLHNASGIFCLLVMIEENKLIPVLC